MKAFQYSAIFLSAVLVVRASQSAETAREPIEAQTEGRATLDVRAFLRLSKTSERLSFLARAIDRGEVKLGMTKGDLDRWLSLSAHPELRKFMEYTADSVVLHCEEQARGRLVDGLPVSDGWPGWYLRIILSKDRQHVRLYYLSNAWIPGNEH